MKLNVALALFLCTMAASCASDLRSVIPNRSNLPASDLPAPALSVGGSAIAFYGLTEDCWNGVHLHAVPLLADGRYGQHVPILLHRNAGRGGLRSALLPNYHNARGEVLNILEMPPGHYEIGGVSCSRAGISYATPSHHVVSYGSFNVQAGMVTFIGTVRLDLIERTHLLDFEITDDSQRAIGDFAASHPSETNRFRVEIAQSSERPTP